VAEITALNQDWLLLICKVFLCFLSFRALLIALILKVMCVVNVPVWETHIYEAGKEVWARSKESVNNKTQVVRKRRKTWVYTDQSFLPLLSKFQGKKKNRKVFQQNPTLRTEQKVCWFLNIFQHWDSVRTLIYFGSPKSTEILVVHTQWGLGECMGLCPVKEAMHPVSALGGLFSWNSTSGSNGSVSTQQTWQLQSQPVSFWSYASSETVCEIQHI
jgi:hypothetical protein